MSGTGRMMHVKASAATPSAISCRAAGAVCSHVLRAFAGIVLGAAMLGSAGCGNAAPSPQPTSGSSPRVAARTVSMTKITIAAGDQQWTAQIEDTPAGREFLAQLPLKLNLKDFGGSEKIADLPRPLTREGAPDAITPKAGDVTFYAPWGNLAIFYRDGHRSPGLIPLGHLERDPAALAAKNPKTVTISRVN